MELLSGSLANCSLSGEGEAASWDELFKNGSDICVGLIRHLPFRSKSLENMAVLVSNVIEIQFFELTNITGLDLVKITSDTSIKYANLQLSCHWHILSLFQKLGKLLTSVKKLLCGGIKIGTELSESSDLSVLSEIKLHGT